MEIITYSCTVKVYHGLDNFSKSDQELIQKARKAVENSYAPYSRFHVGAALRLKSGEIICGNNQENVAYPSGLCAERVALFYASATHPGESIETIAITALAQDFDIAEPVAPCGACRQVMGEYEKNQGKNIKVIMMSNNNTYYVVESCKSLLPIIFEADQLKKI
jgi:cytidine deaminase